MSEDTNLPYVFDLFYDMKSVKELHDHLTGVRRLAIHTTDRELIEMAITNGVPLPKTVEIKVNTRLKNFLKILTLLLVCAFGSISVSWGIMALIGPDAFCIAFVVIAVGALAWGLFGLEEK